MVELADPPWFADPLVGEAKIEKSFATTVSTKLAVCGPEAAVPVTVMG
jgi:hypothetical protein